MGLDEAIYARLQAVTAVTDLVSTRVNPAPLPENETLPAITYQRISGGFTRAMGTDAGVTNVRVQVSAWDDNHDGARDVRDAVLGALKRWSGTAAGETVDAVYYLNELDLYEDDKRIHRVLMDFEFWHRED